MPESNKNIPPPSRRKTQFQLKVQHPRSSSLDTEPNSLSAPLLPPMKNANDKFELSTGYLEDQQRCCVYKTLPGNINFYHSRTHGAFVTYFWSTVLLLSVDLYIDEDMHGYLFPSFLHSFSPNPSWDGRKGGYATETLRQSASQRIAANLSTRLQEGLFVYLIDISFYKI